MTKHVHVWTKGLGSATIGGRRYSRYWICTRCKAKRKP